MNSFSLVLMSVFIVATGLPATADSLPHDGALTDTDIHYVGRWDKSDSSVYHSYWSGAYLRTAFTGTSVSIKLAAGTSLAVIIDGEPERDFAGAAGTVALNDVPLSAKKVHTVQVGGDGQNPELEFQGLVLDPGAVTKPTANKPIVEFIGDSITAFNHNYAWQTAEALDVDHTQIAFSGRALTTGFGCADDKVGLDTQYFMLKSFQNFHHLDNPQIPWNFSYQPRVVVVNLGQNDQCGNEPAATMTTSMVNFVQHVRGMLPKAQIAVMRPFGGPFEAAIKQAVDTLNAQGDKHVVYVDTTGWLKNPDDFRDGVHPNEIGSAKAAARLAPILKPYLK